MHDFNRRDFLRGSTIAAAASTFGLLVPGDAVPASTSPSSPRWDAGRVRHLLPTVSDSRVLVKASFRSPLMEAPTLRIGNTTIRGRMTDTRGEFWQFYAVHPQTRPPLHRGTLGQSRPHPLRAMEPRNLSGARREAGGVSRAVLHVRGRS